MRLEQRHRGARRSAAEAALGGDAEGAAEVLLGRGEAALGALDPVLAVHEAHVELGV